MSVDHDVDVALDPDRNTAQITCVEVRELPVRDLFRDGQLRLWEDTAGWSGYILEDGEFYKVNSHADTGGWITKRPVNAETVAQAIAQHVEDPHAGEAGEFVRGATPP